MVRIKGVNLCSLKFKMPDDMERARNANVNVKGLSVVFLIEKWMGEKG